MTAKSVERMIELLEDCCGVDTVLPHADSFVRYSEYYSTTKLRELSGVSFKEYVEKSRRENAARSKKSIDSHILDIALDCGFSSSEILSAACSSDMSCPPMIFRDIAEE